MFLHGHRFNDPILWACMTLGYNLINAGLSVSLYVCSVAFIYSVLFFSIL